MDSLENNNNILKQTEEPEEETNDVIRDKTSLKVNSYEMKWLSPEDSAALHSTVPAPQPDSTFSPPLSASRSLTNAWSDGDGQGYPSLGVHDQHSGPNNVTFNSSNNFNSEQSGYLLPCNTTDPVTMGSLNYWRTVAESMTATSSHDVRQIPSSYSFAMSHQFDGSTGGEFISPGLYVQPGQASTPSYDSVASPSSTSSWESSIYPPSPGSTMISSPVHELPTFMSPVETVKPCPQNCQCHGFNTPVVNNHGNMMVIYPMPDLLHNTKPGQFSTPSGTTSTMCVTSPLVCPGPFQQPSPPTSFKPFRPGFADDESRNSTSSSSSLSLVSSASPTSHASEFQTGPHDREVEQEGAYPVQVVKSPWFTSLVNQDESNVDKAVENEQIKPVTASMTTNPTLETEVDPVFVPPLFVQDTPQNYDKPSGGDLPPGTNESASSHDVSDDFNFGSPPDYHQAYHHTLPARFPPEFQPSTTFYPSPDYPAYLAAQDYPGRYTIQYHAQPNQPHSAFPSSTSSNYASILRSRLTSHSFSPFDDWRVGVQRRPDRRWFPSRDDSGQPRPHTHTPGPTDVYDFVVEQDREKQPRRPQSPNRRPTGKSLVDLFPDLMPVIAWCINYPQNISTSSPKLRLTTSQIREIVIECVPGIKERGGIGKSTIMNKVRALKKKMRNKVRADETTATPMSSPVLSSMPLSSKENFADRPTLPTDPVSSLPVLKENSEEHLRATADAISSTTTCEADDDELPSAPTESILRSLIKLVDDLAKAGKPARLTPSLKPSMKTSKSMAKSASMIAVRNNVWHQLSLHNKAQQKNVDPNTSTTIGYDSDTGATMFRSLLEAHDIAVDDVKTMRTSDTLYPAPSDCAINSFEAQSPMKSSDILPEVAVSGCSINGSEAQSPIKSSDIQPEVAVSDEEIKMVTDSTKLNDHNLDDDDVMVIDTAADSSAQNN